MTNLQSIPGIGKASLELLEAAGFSTLEALAKVSPEELFAELTRANQVLNIAKKLPARKNVAKWVESAKEQIEAKEAVATEISPPVNYELSDVVMPLIEAAPFAIPLPARYMMEQKLAVNDIPAAILLNRYSGDLEVRSVDRTLSPMSSPGESKIQRLDALQFKSTDVLLGAKPRSPTSPAESDRVALIRGPLEVTNRGRDPKSRRFIKGVLHSHPVSLAMGAVVTMIMIFLIPLSIASAGLLLLSNEIPQHFHWVPKWLLVFPICLPVFAIFYLIFGLQGTCRICGQRLFAPRKCLKNSKAHHVIGLGYIVPLCFHLLLFRWFRCTYCGTPVRLVK